MRRPITFTKGVALGALAMFFWDPRNGERRRAQVRDKTLGFFKSVDGAVQSAVTNLGDRLENLKGRTSQALRKEEVQKLPGAEDLARGLEKDSGRFLSVLREPLSPGARWAVGAAGGALLLSFFPRCSMKRLALGVVGLALVSRAIVNASTEEEQEAPHEERAALGH